MTIAAADALMNGGETDDFIDAHNCYNILMAFCDELKAYITGFMRSGNTYTTWELADTVKFCEKRGNCENYIKDTKYDMNIGSLKMESFRANEAFSQIMMMVYNIFLLFKMDRVSAGEYRQWILTFRLKYVFVAGKIIKTARQTILKLMEGYTYKEVFG